MANINKRLRGARIMTISGRRHGISIALNITRAYLARLAHH